MKTFPVFLLLMLSIQCGYAQWKREWSLGYAYTSPTGKMKQNIKQGHGIVFDYLLLAPSKKYTLGVDMNYTIYGFDKTRQQYTFGDGTTADMDVQVTNSIFNLMASSQYNLVTGKKITPYVGFKLGYSWYITDLGIYDPDDFDSCKPIETDLLQKDGTWVYALGGGIKYDFSTLFKKMRKEVFFINLSVFYTQGGMVSYMNTDMPDAQNTSHSSNRSGDVEASFINTQTQVVHKHHIGNLYSSYAQMMDYRITLSFRSR